MKVSDVEVDLSDAKSVLAGYCFSPDEEVIDWQPQEPTVGDPLSPTDLRAPIWSYRFYDCVPPAPGDALEMIDILVVTGLEVGMNFSKLRTLVTLAPFVSDAVSSIPNRRPFWELDLQELPEEGIPPAGTKAWHLYRAWWILISAGDVGIAITHKLLHHKWPSLFPLLDNKTAARLGGKNLWRKVLQDLQATPSEWAELEHWFERKAREAGGRPVSRLRMHDILLWCVASENWDSVLRLGRNRS